MILLLDNYDSFTYNLLQRIGELGLGLQIQVIRNDAMPPAQAEQSFHPTHMIISPGPCTPNEAGLSCDYVRHFHGRVPILGVCLGHQAIGQVFGGKVVRAERLMHGKTSQIVHDGKTIFAGLPNPFTATRYHSLIGGPGRSGQRLRADRLDRGPPRADGHSQPLGPDRGRAVPPGEFPDGPRPQVADQLPEPQGHTAAMKTAPVPSATSAAPRRGLHPHGTAAAVLGAVVVAIFADVLADVSGRVVGQASLVNDLFKQFAYWREFGFTELARGNLALWNPHIFCGCPFFGGMQSALLYPPNWLFMLLPLAMAVNLSFALHLWLTGVLMYAWAFYRGLRAVAATAAGAIAMLSGAVFLQLLPGHLPHLCTVAWAPLVLLAVDGLIDRPSLRWVLLGSLAAAMQILAGHPQYFFYTAVAAAVYGAVQLVRARQRWRSAVGMAAMFAAGATLAAVQLLTTFSESSETLRSGLSVAQAGEYSFPPENLLCFLAPGLLGGTSETPYWGRWFLWEVQPFIGVAGLMLATYGALAGGRGHRRYAAWMAAVCIVLALGAYIPPLFRLAHDYVPGFGRFRNSGRFIYPATLFLAMLAGVGLSALVQAPPRPRRWAAMVVLAAAVVMGGAAVLMHAWAGAPNGGAWATMLRSIQQTQQSWMAKGSPQTFAEPGFARQVGQSATWAMAIASVTAAVLAGILLAAGRWPKLVYAIALVAVVELTAYGLTQRPTFELRATQPPGLADLVRGRGDDTRTLNPVLPNLAMAVGGEDLWGYDSFVLRRYMEFIYFTQGWPLEDVDHFQHIGVIRPAVLMTLLRCRDVVVPGEGGLQVIRMPPPMQRVQLVGQYLVCPGGQNVLKAMKAPDFDPRRTVILEQEPPIKPTGAVEGGWEVVESSTNTMTIEAEVSAPAILLVTDAYSKHWRARALPGSSQKDYAVMPADYCLRAIPLEAGRHHIRLEYRPVGFLIGRWVSLGAVAAYLAAGVLCVVRGRRRRARGNKPAYPPVTYVNPRRIPSP